MAFLLFSPPLAALLQLAPLTPYKLFANMARCEGAIWQYSAFCAVILGEKVVTIPYPETTFWDNGALLLSVLPNEEVAKHWGEHRGIAVEKIGNRP